MLNPYAHGMTVRKFS